MAQTTTNYSLPYPEGSDTVNLLTILPQLAQLIDAQMKTNANTGIQRGTHAKSGTVNAIIVPNELATGTFFTFVASDDFTEGDSFTFNGEIIAARTPAGTALKTGSFTINQNVLCCNYNGILTIYTNQMAISVDQALSASSTNAISNAAVTEAITDLNTALGSGDISAIGVNVKAAILALNSAITVANGAIAEINQNLVGLNDRVGASDISSPITITNSYIAQSDGYLRLGCGTNNYIVARIESTNNVALFIGAYGSSAREGFNLVFVKKGMTISKQDTSDLYSTLIFYPLA